MTIPVYSKSPSHTAAQQEHEQSAGKWLCSHLFHRALPGRQAFGVRTGKTVMIFNVENKCYRVNKENPAFLFHHCTDV